MTDIALTNVPNVGRRRRRVGLCGIASGVLLVAAYQWAHHWNPLSVAIVAAWAVRTAVAFVGGVRLQIRPGWEFLGFLGKVGMVFSALSVGALIITALAYAITGSDPTGSCGGG